MRLRSPAQTRQHCRILSAAAELWERRAVRHYAEQHAMELDREPSVHTLAKLVAQARCKKVKSRR